MTMLPLSLELPVISALLSAILYTGLALRLRWSAWLGRNGDAPSRLFALSVVASGAWSWAAVFADSLPTRVVDLLDLFRYGCWYLFMLALLEPAARRNRLGGIGTLAPITAALMATAVVGLFVEPSLNGASNGQPRLTLALGLALPVTGLILVEQLFRNVPEDTRWSAKPLCLGIGVVFATDLYLYSEGLLFGHLDRDAVSVRAAIHAFAVLLFFVAVGRRKAVGLRRLRISRSAAFHSTALLLSGAYLLAVAAVGYYVRDYGGQWGIALQQIALGGSLVTLVALMLSGAMRSRLRVWIRRNFFSYRYDYREEWLRFTDLLSAPGGSAQMGTLVIRALANMVESPGGAMWARVSGQTVFAQTARWNAFACDAREATDSAFCRLMSTEGRLVDLDHRRRPTSRTESPAMPTWLTADVESWLVVPLVAADDLVGFVVLTRPRAPVEIDWEVTELLNTASRQAASVLMQLSATEELLETRQFDAFNRMSAFVVHDLKNVVAQLGLMMRNAARHRDNPEFQKDMLATVENSLEKMQTLMLQLRDPQMPAGNQPLAELNAVVRNIGASCLERGRTIELKIDAGYPLVARGHRERLERVLKHIVQNALDATPPQGRVWLRLACSDNQALIEVGDTGDGMSSDYITTHLFKPFRSTKPAGMGIGAYESFQYVRELGGGISVDSKLGHGTIMTIKLPLLNLPASSELRQPSDVR